MGNFIYYEKLEDYERQTDNAKLVDLYKNKIEKAKEDIEFCLRSIKQEWEMSKDERTRKEMATCFAILNDTLKELKKDR